MQRRNRICKSDVATQPGLGIAPPESVSPTFDARIFCRYFGAKKNFKVNQAINFINVLHARFFVQIFCQSQNVTRKS
jgi:hypothetical protein